MDTSLCLFYERESDGQEVCRIREPLDCICEPKGCPIVTNPLKRVLYDVYRKHVLNDDTIGWDELGDDIWNAFFIPDRKVCPDVEDD